MNKFKDILLKHVDSSTLGIFRIFFGSLMFIEIIRYFTYGRIYQYFIKPEFYFNHYILQGVNPLPGNGMYFLFALLAVSALGIASGIFYRISSLIFFLGYTYIFLLDKANYNNHYYLISLISFLFIFLDANRSFSISNLKKLKKGIQQFVPFWQVFILRAQIFIIYFYGGIAKLNMDWLAGEPLRKWLKTKANYPVVGSFFDTETAVFFFSYGGLFFDLAICFFLINKSTRLLAFIAILFFNLVNNWLFTIGIFPFVMIGASVIFIEPDSPRKFFNKISEFFISADKIAQTVNPDIPDEITVNSSATFKSPKILTFVFIYLIIQLTFPLRHWIYPGNVSWTEEGHRFSWHMKLRSKLGAMRVYIIDPKTMKKSVVNLKEDLTDKQISILKINPDMILQYVHYLKTKLEKKGVEKPVIKVIDMISLNSRPHQLLINPKVNLSEVTYSPFGTAHWIMPLEGELSHTKLIEFLLTFSALILAGVLLIKVTGFKITN